MLDNSIEAYAKYIFFYSNPSLTLIINKNVLVHIEISRMKFSTNKFMH